MTSETFIPNSTQIPNDYVDKFMAFLTPEEWKVLTYAARRIFGFQKRQDRISLTQFSEGISRKDGERLDYGTGLTLHSTRKAVDGLVKAGLLVLLEPASMNHTPALYMLQLNPEGVGMDYLQRRREGKKAVNVARMNPARSARDTAEKPSSKRVHATEQVHATIPELLHATEDDYYTPQEPQKQEKKRENNNLLLSFFASLSEEQRAFLDSVKAVFGGDWAFSEKQAKHWISRLEEHGEAKTLGYLKWAEKEGFNHLKAYHTDKKHDKVPGWQVEEDKPESDSRSRMNLGEPEPEYRIHYEVLADDTIQAWAVYEDGRRELCESSGKTGYYKPGVERRIVYFPELGRLNKYYTPEGKEVVAGLLHEGWISREPQEGDIVGFEIFQNGSWIRIPSEGDVKLIASAQFTKLISGGDLSLSEFATYHNGEWIPSTYEEAREYANLFGPKGKKATIDGRGEIETEPKPEPVVEEPF